jgi:hypothetical protein
LSCKIKKAPLNTYFIEEEYGYRHWIWFDTKAKFSKEKLREYSKLSTISKKHFPGEIAEVSIMILRDPKSGDIHYFNNEKEKVSLINESEIKRAAYGIKTENGYKFFFAEGLISFGIDCYED